MKVTFYSNFLNHHQLFFCEEMYKKLKDDFKFVATEHIPEEKIKIGYEIMDKDYPFLIKAYEEGGKKEAEVLACKSEVVIIGSAPEEYIKERLKNNQITFRYYERYFKKGQWRIILPNHLRYMYEYHTKYRHKNVFMLCASAYTAVDFGLAGAYWNKTYKWGYFPQVKKQNLNELFNKKKKNKIEILWVGRFIKWKHPEIAIKIAEMLRNDGYEFNLKFIGTGELEEKLKLIVKKKKLKDYIEFLGPMHPHKVRELMEEANIFLFTSDYNEGWGAVLNEAMNSGCAIVASHAIGSVPFLIEHNKNGVIYRNNKLKDLYIKLKGLMDNSQQCEQLGRCAYHTVYNIWSPQNATNNLLKLFNAKIIGKDLFIKEGPCSKAEVIWQSLMYTKITNERKGY